MGSSLAHGETRARSRRGREVADTAFVERESKAGVRSGREVPDVQWLAVSDWLVPW
jgi:hypothetical protein